MKLRYPAGNDHEGSLEGLVRRLRLWVPAGRSSSQGRNNGWVEVDLPGVDPEYVRRDLEAGVELGLEVLESPQPTLIVLQEQPRKGVLEMLVSIARRNGTGSLHAFQEPGGREVYIELEEVSLEQATLIERALRAHVAIHRNNNGHIRVPRGARRII